jgi:hypothetical protein
MYIMEENKFKCNTCNKYYKSYKSLWNHKNKFHTDIPTNIPIISPDIPMISPKNNNDCQPNIKKIDKRNCDYCNKILSSYKNLHRHLQTCKYKKQEQEKKDMKKELEDLRKMVADLINSKTNGSNNNSNNTTNTNSNNNTTNNNNNGTINNNYITIVPIGKENFVEVTTEKEHLYILKQGGNEVLYKCIEKKHFNENLPQFHNFMIPNKRVNEVKIYDETMNNLKTEKKGDIVDTVILNAENDLDDMYKLHKNKINNEQKTNVRRIIDESETPLYVEERVGLIGYDNKDIVINTHKKNKKQLMVQ